MNRFLILLTLFCLMPYAIFAQNWEWLRQSIGTNSNGDDHGYEIVNDEFGNSYVTGHFESNVNFGFFNLSSPNSTNVFIAKYDISGNVLWAKKAGGSGNDAGFGVCLDNSGNTYVTGQIFGTANFDTISLSSSSGSRIFLAKYDNSGNLIWVKDAGQGPTSNNSGFSVKYSSANEIYLTGTYQGTLIMGNDTLQNGKTFLAKLDTNGNYIWAKNVGIHLPMAGGSYYLYSLGLDQNNNSVVVGSFSDTLLFLNDTLIAEGYSDIIIAKYDENGSNLWAKKAGGSLSNGPDECYSVDIDSNNNILTAGYFYSTAMFDSISITSYGGADIFIAKWKENGEIQWVKNAGGTSEDYGFGIHLMNDNSILITGDFVFDAIFGSTVLNSVSNGYELVIAKYDSLGNFISSWQSVGTNPTDNFLGWSVSTYIDNIFVSGIFQGTANFDNVSITSTGFCDVLVAKIGINKLSIPDLTESNSLNIFPNPFASEGTLIYTPIQGEYYYLEIYDVTGKLIQKSTYVNQPQIIVKRNNLPSGLYLFNLSNKNEKIGIGKFIIN